ncbi:FRG domain-containing protein [Prosthecobacter debontii]|uniref:FRG domain-containing protein n=1 Tax=Prosthecobacter debontii TaxID=48467 RepID=A0A1T4YJP3_9BACT|nr:FRG domain-containing protein [Prosthecobacter debontii]SKB01910.1 FRG domain-containing protein [Prosthecobacter debontii]
MNSDHSDLIKTLRTQRKLTVESVEKAVSLAHQLKHEQLYDLFRGQTNAAWRVQPTAHRCNAKAFEEARIRFQQFRHWARNQTELENYTDDQLWAIAQHYGFKTHFLDFSFCPEVAGFFACESTSGEVDQKAAIYCINSKQFLSVWNGSDNQTATVCLDPELIVFNIDNLWRLSAQCGCFIFLPGNHAHGLAAAYPEMVRIEFPWVPSHESLPRKNAIYPSQASPLEQRIDQFLHNEVIAQANNFLSSISSGPPIIHSTYTPPEEWTRISIPASEDWQSAAQGWRHRGRAPFETKDNIPVIVNNKTSKSKMLLAMRQFFSLESVVEHREKQLLFETATRMPLLYDACETWEDEAALKIILCVSRQWEGMRLYPYSDEEIHRSIMTTLSLLRIRLVEKSFRYQKKYTEKVEFCPNPKGVGAMSAGRVSKSALKRALNPHFKRAVKQMGAHLPYPFVQCPEVWLPALPTQRFSFAGLRQLLVSDLIPTQIVERGDFDGQTFPTRSLFFSPFDFAIFGPA